MIYPGMQTILHLFTLNKSNMPDPNARSRIAILNLIVFNIQYSCLNVTDDGLGDGLLRLVSLPSPFHMADNG